MELTKALLCYLGSIVLIFLIMLRLGLYPISAIIITLLLGQIILNIIKPPYTVDAVTGSDSSTALYVVIQIGTPIVVIIYVFDRAFNDRKSLCS